MITNVIDDLTRPEKRTKKGNSMSRALARDMEYRRKKKKNDLVLVEAQSLVPPESSQNKKLTHVDTEHPTANAPRYVDQEA